MNVFELVGDLFLFLMLIAVVTIILVTGLSTGAYKCTRMLNGCSGPPSPESGRRGYCQMVSDIARKHADPGDRHSMTDEEKLKHHMVHDVLLGDASCGAESFIRLCHMVGLEIVLRPVNDSLTDTEKEPEETRKRLRRIRKKYLRAHGKL